MWEKNKRVYRNNKNQEVTLHFRPTKSSDWKYQDIVYKRIYEVKLETQWGVRQFWYCFPDAHFTSENICEMYLRSEALPFEPIEHYLRADVSHGLDFGAIFPHISSHVLVFGRAH